MMNKPQQSSNIARGYATALISAMVLSLTGVFISYLTQTHQLPAMVLAFWRDVFSCLTLLIGLSIFKPGYLKIHKSQLGYLIFFGFIFAFFNSFWTLSVWLNGASVATVLVYCSPAFSAILGVWLLKDKLDAVRIGTILFCLGGCVLVAGAFNVQAWESNIGGIITGLLSGLTYAMYTLLGKKAAQRNINPWTSLTYIFGFAALVLLIVNLLFSGVMPGTAPAVSGLIPQMNYKGWGALLALAAGPTVLGFVLCNISLIYLSPNLTNLILTSEPAFTSVIAFFLLNERLDAMQITGTILILGAVLFLRLHEGRKEKQAAKDQQLDAAGFNVSVQKLTDSENPNT